MTEENKTGSGTPSEAGGPATAKTDSTASARAAARKKQQQQKNQKANPPTEKKKQPQVTKSSFEGNASGVSPMKGIVIAQGNGNLAGQFRVFQKKLAGAAADDKAYGLDSAIINLVGKVKSDFVKPKPDPLVHSNLVDIMEKDEKGASTRIPTGERRLVCHDPVLKDQMEAEYSMDLKIQKSNWNQFERFLNGYYRTAIGNVEDNIITYCRADSRMALIESTGDLIGLLLVLRSVCAQNNGAVKVDEEYQNLGTLHSAVAYKQKKNTSNSKYADEVADRYGSTIFTSGKFTFGLAVYEKVLKTYASTTTTPLTFIQYLQLSPDNQLPIDELVRERTVARLIIKNSSNLKLREHLMTAYSTGDTTCYPNTISDALSLLSTFAKTNKDAGPEDIVVSYHETVNTKDDEADDVAEEVDPYHLTTNDETNVSDVTFDATVMAAVIAEATAHVDEAQFFGASFPQLQEVDDAYTEGEPDNVCFAHIVEPADANADTTDVININYPDHMKDFELIMYHTAQRIKNTKDVYTINYNPDRPDLISYNYCSQVAESIIDYSDALRIKFKQAGIHDSTDLMNIFGNQTDSAVASDLKLKFNEVGLKSIHLSTVTILREETIRNLAHFNYNTIRYNQMTIEIGTDMKMETFPNDNALIHHVVSATAIMQHRRRPNRWVNKITHKLIKAGITSIQVLETKLDSDCLNDYLGRQHFSRLHHITLIGLQQVLGMTDFRQGRS